MNGAFRLDYPMPLRGNAEEQLAQIRNDLMRVIDGVNMILDRLETLERRMEEGGNGDDA